MQQKMIEDQKIIELYWERNEDAILQTDRKYGAYCMTIAQQILSDMEDAKECVNETWWKTWNAIPPSKPTVLRLFLAKITRNLSFDRYKAEHAQKRGNGEVALALDELSECVSSEKRGLSVEVEKRRPVEEELEAKELQSSINRFLGTLKKRDRSIFIRRYFYATSVKEIAERYGISERNCLMILSRSRHRLRMHLVREGYIV